MMPGARYQGCVSQSNAIFSRSRIIGRQIIRNLPLSLSLPPPVVSSRNPSILSKMTQ